ncbi:hypothetical protein FG93_03750 [Bosea sp. LC85]|nr:hypothetical protein FG93_03750 [Bosea sp. LC85]
MRTVTLASKIDMERSPHCIILASVIYSGGALNHGGLL